MEQKHEVKAQLKQYASKKFALWELRSPGWRWSLVSFEGESRRSLGVASLTFVIGGGIGFLAGAGMVVGICRYL